MLHFSVTGVNHYVYFRYCQQTQKSESMNNFIETSELEVNSPMTEAVTFLINVY